MVSTTWRLPYLRDYTVDGYKPINSALRNGEYRVEVDDIIEDLLTLEPFEGITYRGMSKEVFKKSLKGKVFSDKAFLSTSKLRVEALAFGGEDRVLLRIEGRSGRSVEEISSYPDEEEVLFLPGTKFQVTDKKSYKGIPVYFLREE